jgi:hypothetical protein
VVLADEVPHATAFRSTGYTPFRICWPEICVC